MFMMITKVTIVQRKTIFTAVRRTTFLFIFNVVFIVLLGCFPRVKQGERFAGLEYFMNNLQGAQKEIEIKTGFKMRSTGRKDFKNFFSADMFADSFNVKPGKNIKKVFIFVSMSADRFGKSSFL